MPWKNSHEMNRPSQMMKPKRHTTYTMASLPMPSSISLWKLDTIPMVKKVRVKKMVRRGQRVLITLLPRGCHSTFTQMNSMITKVSR